MVIEIKITPEMKHQFYSEVVEHLDHLEKMLLAIEKKPDDQEAIHAIFRDVHSIKGNSAYIGINDINVLSHELEDLMDKVRSGNISVTGNVLSLLFEGIDLLRDMNSRITEENYQESDISGFLTRIRNTKNTAHKDVTPPSTSRKRVGLNVEGVFKNSSVKHIEYIRGVAQGVLAGETIKGGRKNVLRVLKTFRTAANYLGASEIVQVLEAMEKELESVKSLRKKRAEFLIEKIDDAEKLVVAMGEQKPVDDHSEKAQPGEAGAEAQKTIELESGLSPDVLDREMRIAPKKIDAFMNQVSELAIAKNTLNYLTEKILSKSVSTERGAELKKVVATIDKITDTLQTDVMKLRLVRINSLFERLPRIVRTLSLQSKKKIELSIAGEETEIDRKVVEQLLDPMIHLIRNSVDHGIESPEQRVNKGKAEIGKLSVKVHQEGNEAIIEIADDGRGLDKDTIAKTALAKKIITQEKLSSMNAEEVINLIFRPGFSTAAKTTEVSGRGVGLDVVKRNLQNIGGNVTIASEPDIATRIRLRVPVSMVIMDVLLTEAGGEQYAFPFSAILETITVTRGEIQILNKRETVPYNSTVLGLKHLQGIMGLAKHRLRVQDSTEELTVIVITFGGHIRGIVVDRILRRDGILSKPLEQHMPGIKEFSGAAILGDGSIVLVLDPMGMF